MLRVQLILLCTCNSFTTPSDHTTTLYTHIVTTLIQVTELKALIIIIIIIIIIIMDICKAPTLRLKALNKHSGTHIIYIGMEHVISNKNKSKLTQRRQEFKCNYAKNAHTRTHARTHAHTRTHARSHARTHEHTHTHTHTHTGRIVRTEN